VSPDESATTRPPTFAGVNEMSCETPLEAVTPPVGPKGLRRSATFPAAGVAAGVRRAVRLDSGDRGLAISTTAHLCALLHLTAPSLLVRSADYAALR